MINLMIIVVLTVVTIMAIWNIRSPTIKPKLRFYTAFKCLHVGANSFLCKPGASIAPPPFPDSAPPPSLICTLHKGHSPTFFFLKLDLHSSDLNEIAPRISLSLSHWKTRSAPENDCVRFTRQPCCEKAEMTTLVSMNAYKWQTDRQKQERRERDPSLCLQKERPRKTYFMGFWFYFVSVIKSGLFLFFYVFLFIFILFLNWKL